MARKRSGGLTVDPEDIRDRLNKGADIEDHEARWLQDRGELPEDYERVPVTFQHVDGTIVTNDPEATRQMAQNLDIESDPRFKAMVEARAQQLLDQLAREHVAGEAATRGEYLGNALNEGTPGSATKGATFPEPDNSEVEEDDESDDTDDEDGEDDGDEDTEEVEDYDEGWTNDSRRAELSKRGQSTEGDKATLIQRLKDTEDSDSEE